MVYRGFAGQGDTKCDRAGERHRRCEAAGPTDTKAAVSSANDHYPLHPVRRSSNRQDEGAEGCGLWSLPAARIC